MENRPRPPFPRERPSLEDHVRRLHGCEDARIAVHSMESLQTNLEETFSTTDVAAKLSELGFNNVFDLGDMSIAQNHGDILTSGQTDKCRPECVTRPSRGHHNRN